MALSREFELLNKYGMHVRPAGALAKLCQHYRSNITVAKDAHSVSGKSVLGLMTLEAPRGTRLTVTADGADAEDALDAIGELFDKQFGFVED